MPETIPICSIDETAVRQYYHLLGHGKQTELRFFGGEKTETLFVKNENEFVRGANRERQAEAVLSVHRLSPRKALHSERDPIQPQAEGT